MSERSVHACVLACVSVMCVPPFAPPLPHSAGNSLQGPQTGEHPARRPWTHSPHRLWPQQSDSSSARREPGG